MPEIFAHRGLHVTERENTIGAFEAAVALGVDGVELDVRRTRDGVLVVHHDGHIGHLVIVDSLASELPVHSGHMNLIKFLPKLKGGASPKAAIQ